MVGLAYFDGLDSSDAPPKQFPGHWLGIVQRLLATSRLQHPQPIPGRPPQRSPDNNYL